jgi:uncharacterized protein
MTDDRISIREKFGADEVDVLYRRSPDRAQGETKDFGSSFAPPRFYPPLDQRTYVEDGIRVDQDRPVKLRDGATIYVDVYRPDGPTGSADLPALVAWGWYGKRPGDAPREWQVLGVPPDTVSKMAKFEGPDPAYWCKQGYAVVNVDSRGSGNSDGNLIVWNDREGRDGYDVIEWIAEQVWSNGKVGMFGNSALAMSQWYIAAEAPPHLACFAPWEGSSDLYREFVTDNGIPEIGFNNFVTSGARGPAYIEDYVPMVQEQPLMNGYWEAKIAKFENIRAPAYVCGGWSHLHLLGSVNGFRRIRSPKKWLRVHREFEWPDTYAWWNLEDLKRFFDRYLKGIRNGWELTPRVRMDVTDAYEYDFQVSRPEREFPLARTRYQKLYLDAAKAALSAEAAPAEAVASYDAAEGFTTFDVTFDEDVELSGYMKAHLWVEADTHDEMDLFLTVQKLDDKGEFLPTSVLGEPHPGAWGRLRVSHRALDKELSTDYFPVQSHRQEEKLKPGEIVPVEIGFYPLSRIWHKGQKLRLHVAGRYFREEGWFQPLRWALDNKGIHKIHTGGRYDSYLQIPTIPPKYRAGDHVFR